MTRLGTVVIVVYKARHLPNKQMIGKQDAYCTLTYGGRTARTPVVKKAGQTPEWDHEERFEIFSQGEPTDVRSEVTATGGVKPTQASPSVRPGKSSGKRELKVAVYADDPRDPELIGSTVVDLEDAIKKGEVDDYFELKDSKNRFAGEVFLELTYWSDAAPPIKRQPKPSKDGAYGGPGTFEPFRGSTPSPPASPAPTASIPYRGAQSNSGSFGRASSTRAGYGGFDEHGRPLSLPPSAASSLSSRMSTMTLTNGERPLPFPSSPGPDQLAAPQPSRPLRGQRHSFSGAATPVPSTFAPTSGHLQAPIGGTPPPGRRRPSTSSQVDDPHAPPPDPYAILPFRRSASTANMRPASSMSARSEQAVQPLPIPQSYSPAHAGPASTIGYEHLAQPSHPLRQASLPPAPERPVSAGVPIDAYGQYSAPNYPSYPPAHAAPSTAYPANHYHDAAYGAHQLDHRSIYQNHISDPVMPQQAQQSAYRPDPYQSSGHSQQGSWESHYPASSSAPYQYGVQPQAAYQQSPPSQYAAPYPDLPPSPMHHQRPTSYGAPPPTPPRPSGPQMPAHQQLPYAGDQIAGPSYQHRFIKPLPVDPVTGGWRPAPSPPTGQRPYRG